MNFVFNFFEGEHANISILRGQVFCILCCWSVRYPRVRAEIPSKVQSTDGAKGRDIPGQREKDETQNP